MHRGLSEILSIIDHSAITPNAKAIASRIFKVIAQAEASVHGCDIETVHFHEVGAIDSIVDIVSAAICLDNLGIEKVYASPLFEGTGYVKCAHGLMPVPAPATAKIMSEHHMKVKITHTQGEMVTPTGAAILAGLDADFTLPEEMVIEKTGMGAGKKEFSHANLLRVHMIETEGKKKHPASH